MEMGVEIALDALKLDASIQVREKLAQDTVDRYRDILDELPPVLVYDIDGQYWLVDGFHRLAAAGAEGRTTIRANVRSGTRAEAEREAISENAKHGKPLTAREKETAVLRLVGGGLSQREIAAIVGCSREFVGKITQAHKVRLQVAEVYVPPEPLPTATYTATHEAPQSDWPRIIEASVDQDWTVKETAAVATEFAEPTTTEDRKQAVLEGREPPVARFADGSAAVLPETVAREVSRGSASAPRLALLSALAATGKVKVFDVGDIADSVVAGAHRERVIDDIESDIAFWQTLVAALRAVPAVRGV